MKTTIPLLLYLLFCGTSAFSIDGDSLRSLISVENITAFKLEEGLSAGLHAADGKTFVKIQADVPTTRDPAAYLVTVPVTPGSRYTYFLKAYRDASFRALLYVASPSGNVVWPGPEVQSGISRSAFTAPAGANEVTLAIAFLSPQDNGHVLIEDLALFPGEPEAWPTGEMGALQLYLKPGKTWVVWIYVGVMSLLVLIFFFTGSWFPPQYRRNVKQSLTRATRDASRDPVNLIVAAGLLLSVYQFLFNRSLWLDEASLALSIVTRTYSELLAPLDYGQVAPILFLWIEKFFSQLFPDTDQGLRFFMLLCHMASIFLVKEVTFQLSKSKLIQAGCLATYTLSTSLLYYSSEVKQYAVDVFVILLLLFLVIRSVRNHKDYSMSLAVAGCVCVWLSNISVLVLFTSGIFLLVKDRKNLFKSSPALPICGTWMISFFLYFIFFIHNHPSRGLMLEYWHSVDAFMPINPISSEFWKFIGKSLKGIFESFLFEFWFLGVALYVTGIAALAYKKQLATLYLLLFPPAVHLVLSALEIYPFDLRLILYQMPLYVFAMVAGAAFLVGLARRNSVRFIVFVPALISGFFLLRTYPLQREELKKTINCLNAHIRPDDKVYVNSGAQRAFHYYRTIQYTQFSNEILFENSFEADFESLHDYGRVWILFSHTWTGEEGAEASRIAYLSKKGDIAQVCRAVGASLYLFKTMSNAALLQSTEVSRQRALINE